MEKCIVCGNNYDKAFEINYKGEKFIFDCFECAIHKLAPVCKSCECKVIGHGVESDNVIYCCAYCAHKDNVPAKDRV